MTVTVQFIPTSEYIHDKEYDWSDWSKGKEEYHLGFVCPHDYIKVEDGSIWCPDCEGSGQGLTPEDIERFYQSQEWEE